MTFDASASSDPDGPLASLRWDLDGDGSYETSGVTASRSYANPGTFTVALLVKDSDGATRRTTRQVVVEAPPGSPADPGGGTGAGGTGSGGGTGAGSGAGSGGGGGSGSLGPGGSPTPAAPSARCSRARPSSASRSSAATAWARPSRSTAAPA